MAARLRVHVQPGAKRGEVVGWQGDALRVRVQAPPVEGRANQAVVELLAEALDVAKSQVAILQGHSGRDKLVAVEGLTIEEIRRRLPPRPVAAT